MIDGWLGFSGFKNLKSLIDETDMPMCKSCELVARRDAGEAPFWDNVARTEFWDVAHDYNTTLPGWLILISRRHIASLDEMSDAEANELGPLIRQMSLGLKEVVGCEKTYVLQFAEKPEHSHVHFHIVPRMADMPAENKGPGVFNYKPASQDDRNRVSEAVMNDIARKIKLYIS